MNKYSLTIEEHIEEARNFHTKSIIHITGNSITELLAKLPLEIFNVIENRYHMAGKTADDDIPF